MFHLSLKVLMFQHVRVIPSYYKFSIVSYGFYMPKKQYLLNDQYLPFDNRHKTIFAKKWNGKQWLMKYFFWIDEHGHHSAICTYFNSCCLLEILLSNVAIILDFLHYKNFTSNLGLKPLVYDVSWVVLETNGEVVEHVELHIKLF